MKLVVVESPAKARTVEKFLGHEYVVRATLGHVRDLPKSKLGVDIDRDFEPQYVIPPQRRQTVARLRQESKRADAIYLATDPDREGEAIAWHLASAVNVDGMPVHRVEFHEVTPSAVLAAMAAPREIDLQMVNAQQARRVLDRLVGYMISPLLWRKVRRGLSAGRVQSVAVRLVVDREREVANFAPEESWSIEAELARRGDSPPASRPLDQFRATLVQRMGQEIHLAKEENATAVLRALEGSTYCVQRVLRKKQMRNPAPPFTTSTLQQEASRKLGFSAKRTMAVAQQLYEGVDIGGQAVGLITYMRTDSTRVSQAAVSEAREMVRATFGSQYLPARPRVYKTKSRLAQEAHEAIRPTSVARDPASLRPYLSADQHRLYELVSRRFVASQMASAVLDITTVEVSARKPDSEDVYLFRAVGSVLEFPGFRVLYLEGKEDEQSEEARSLPPLVEGEPLDLLALVPSQHFTQPPPRYTEATLVKALEEKGIGRPSTYAPILSTIQERGYVEKVDKRLRPTALGTLVNDVLVEHFPDIVDVEFTARLEEKLDRIAQGEMQWVPVVRDFYNPFTAQLEEADENLGRVRIPEEPTDEACERCGRPMVIRLGKYGRFLACTGFPQCRNAKPIQTKLGILCPDCGAELAEKKTRRGLVFYGCSSYPTCQWVSWHRPIQERCSRCGGLQVQVGKNGVHCSSCDGEIAARSAGKGRGRLGAKARAKGGA